MSLKKATLQRRLPNGNYKKEFIDKVVQLIEGGLSRSEASLKYGIPPTTITTWMINYGSPDHHNSRKPVSIGFKRKVIREIEQGRITIKEARTVYRIKNEHTIRRWRREFQKENTELAGSIQDMADKQPIQPSSATSEAEIKTLQQALKEAELKIAALNTLIDVAEEQLKINIRKKPGAKQ